METIPIADAEVERLIADAESESTDGESLIVSKPKANRRGAKRKSYVKPKVKPKAAAKRRSKPPKPAFGDLPDDGFIRISGLVPKVLPVNPATIWNRVAKGTFPKPIRLGAKVTAWRVGDIRAWIAKQVAISRATPRRVGRIQKKSTTEAAPVAEASLTTNKKRRGPRRHHGAKDLKPWSLHSRT